MLTGKQDRRKSGHTIRKIMKEHTRLDDDKLFCVHRMDSYHLVQIAHFETLLELRCVGFHIQWLHLAS